MGFLILLMVIGYVIFVLWTTSNERYDRNAYIFYNNNNNNRKENIHFKAPPSSLGKMVRHNVKSRVKK